MRHSASQLRRATSVALSLAILSLLAVATAAPAAASEQSESARVRPTDTDFTRFVEIAQFDQTNGILRSVEVVVAASTDGRMRIENTSNSSGSSGTVSLGATITVASVDEPSVEATAAFPAADASFTLDVFDGDADFDGPSGEAFPGLSGTDTVSTTFTDPADLAVFIGTGVTELSVAAVAVGTAEATGGNVVLDFETTAAVDISVIYQFEAPSIDISKSPNNQTVPLNGDATFRIDVTNNGEADLFNVTVTDPVTPSCELFIGDLAVGETETYRCTFEGATEDFVNVATVVGEDILGNQVTDEDDANVNVIAPDIEIIKSPDDQVLVFGGEATFTIDVTNTGDLDLFNVTVVDPLAPDCDAVIGDLPIGATVSYPCTVPDVLADFTNVATVTGEDEEGNQVSDEDDAPVDVLAPAIEILKTPDDQTVVVGRNAVFTITVTNIGDVDLFNVVVTDPLLPQCDTTLESLPVGESISYDCRASMVFEQFTNVAEVTAEDEEGNQVTDEDDAIVRVREPDEGELPVTGDDSTELTIAGLLMVLLGAVLINYERLRYTDNS